MERVFTCDGLCQFGHGGIISAAVSYKSVGQNKTAFTGQLYVSFANHEVASMFQSYWRDRPMYTSPHKRDDKGNIIERGQCRLMQCGPSNVVGKRHYKRGPYDRTFTRWGADVWQFWGPCSNQSTTRQMAGLEPIPDGFWFDGVWVNKITHGHQWLEV